MESYGRLVEEPKAFPFLDELSQIFRGVDQLLGPTLWVGGVGRDDAADHRNVEQQISNSKASLRRISNILRES